MPHPAPLNEKSMQYIEARIPELASSAVKLAYYQALTSGGRVITARQGQLIETRQDGVERIIRTIAPPTAVRIGQKRKRKA
jgi:hypothetical protein